MIQEHPIDHDDSCEDLTLHFTDSDQVASRCIRVLSMGVLKPRLPDECSGQNLSTFDLTYSDDNEDWTLCKSPTRSLSSCGENLPQVRVMADASTPVEIILDSGADISALPRSYGNVGVEVGQHEAQFIDAQGSPLHLHSTRVAKVTFGDVTLKERFISHTCLGTFGQSRMVLAIQWSRTVLDERSQVFQGWIQKKFVVCNW